MFQMSVHFNVKKNQYIGKVKLSEGWKTVFINRSITTEKEAERYLLERFDTVPVGEEKTIEALGGRWLKLRETDGVTKPRTLVLYRSAINKHFESVKKLNLEKDFSIQVVKDWIAGLKIKPNSKLAYISAFRTFFRDSIIEEWLDPEMTSPFDKLAIKKVIRGIKAAKKRNIIFFTKEETEKLINGSQKSVKMGYLLAFLTGMRRSEMLGLLATDFHLDEKIPYVSVTRQLEEPGTLPFVHIQDGKRANGQALVSDPKCKSARNIPLHPTLVSYIREWEMKDGFWADGRLEEKRLLDRLIADLKRLDIERNGRTWHSLRRTTATLLGASGARQEVIGAILGHGATNVTEQHYLMVLMEQMYSSICQLDIKIM